MSLGLPAGGEESVEAEHGLHAADGVRADRVEGWADGGVDGMWDDSWGVSSECSEGPNGYSSSQSGGSEGSSFHLMP